MNPEEAAFLIQAGFKFDFNKAQNADDTSSDWLNISAGISEASPEPNEELDQTPYYDGGGYSETDVVGKQETYSFSGHRKYGDPAQDYIFNELNNVVGPERKGTFRVTYPDGAKLTGNATVANIVGPGGAANAKGECSFEIHFNGKPEFTPATAVV